MTKISLHKLSSILFNKLFGNMLSRINYRQSCKKIERIRNLDRPINFVFVLYDLSSWKSEDLYCQMLLNQRFNPILAVTKNTNLVNNELKVIDYLNKKGYPYIFLDGNKRIIDQVEVDILMYQRPYLEFSPLHYWKQNKKAVVVRLGYGFHSLLEPWLLMNESNTNAWQDYYENKLNVEDCLRVTKNKRFNLVVTGIPIMDRFALPKEKYKNPWKNGDSRKKIIWAPHHTIGDNHSKGIAYGTFLEIADDMLKLAKIYSDKVYWSFKPHPQLRKSLFQVGWSEEKINDYYNQWDNLIYSQVDDGEYMGLFKYSDAMIHDCSSFTMEYICIGNPVMYIERQDRQSDNTNRTTNLSYEMHYHGKNVDDIRKFIDNVIAGVDLLKEERIEFVNKYLRPPHGKTACENIMNAILGVEEYKDC